MRKFVCLLLGGMAMVSCVPSTPQTRIERNPAAFAALSAKDQELVRQGSIAKGMRAAAVLLAWGEPSARLEGFRDGKTSERWEYTGSEPVYTNSVYGGFGYYGGYRGRYGRYHGPYVPYGYGFGPTVTYVPYCRSRVWFVNGRVDAWERLQ
jgi:hypothetical protein